ncbi:metallophosphoesterase [Asanoa sp. NPDC049573]|uniref:metallophosphoesterase n=1 Tax=Asanoa sp. NPDC049573 TaxID=3155396 RepID=UPI00341A00E4
MLAVVGLALIGLIHFYLWKRLVRDATRPGPWRRAGTVVAVVLGLLVPATLIGTRVGVTVLAWPGYLWIALMFYLLVVLVLLEIPMLVARIVVRRRPATSNQPVGDNAPVASGQPAAARRAVETTDQQRVTGEHEQHQAADDATRQPTAARRAVETTDQQRVASEDEQRQASGRPAEATGTTQRRTLAQHEVAQSNGDAPGQADATAARNETQAWTPGIERRLLLARGAAIFAGLTATGITAYGARTALGAPRLDRVQITLAKLPRSMDGFRIATVSDIHLGPLAGRAHTERIVAAVNRTNADLVAVVGDLVDGSVREIGAAAAPLRDMRSRHGSFFVTGNHEYYSGADEWLAEVERLGIRTLRNERELISRAGGAFDLAGVNDVAGEGTSTGGPDIPGALRDRDATIPVVLLAHQPVQVHDAAKQGVDLQLSGHTHGGQMAPFNLLVKLDQPVVRGYARFGDTQLYVTNGAGFWGPPVRVGAPPQVTLVELRSP